jgi:hypothetical protein
MNANARIYRSVILHAVFGEGASEAKVFDVDLLNRVAEHLADCEEAKSILRALGYGSAGMLASEVAATVPENVGQLLKKIFHSKPGANLGE